MIQEKERFKPFTKVWYWDTANDKPCVCIDNWFYEESKYNFSMYIRYNYNDEYFTFYFFDRNWEKNDNDIPEDVKKKLLENGFKDCKDQKVNGLLLEIEKEKNFNDIESKILEITNALKPLDCR